jgi:DNA-binding LytR/AlgR family response regulator
LNSLIIDDERPLADYLASLIANERPDWQLTVISDSLQALEALSTQAFDAVFCDIRMPALSGLKLLQLNQQLAHPCPCWVFVTAYDDYAVQAFELAAVDYLLKPIQLPRLQQTLQRLEASNVNSAAQLQTLSQQLTPPKEPLQWLKLLQGNELKLVAVDDIHYFQAEDKLVGVYSDKFLGWIRLSIKELTEKLPDSEFVQIHRSLLVRMAQIDNIKKDELGHWQVYLKQGKVLPMSRQFQRGFKGD